MTNTNEFSLEMEARDHEYDVQGVVNNAHYQHYFEHARHRFLKLNDIDFHALVQQGINLMVAKIEIEYFASLKAHDQFIVSVVPNRISRLRVCFRQELRDSLSKKLMAVANTTVVTVNNQQKPLRKSPLERLI